MTFGLFETDVLRDLTVKAAPTVTALRRFLGHFGQGRESVLHIRDFVTGQLEEQRQKGY